MKIPLVTGMDGNFPALGQLFLQFLGRQSVGTTITLSLLAGKYNLYRLLVKDSSSVYHFEHLNKNKEKKYYANKNMLLHMSNSIISPVKISILYISY